MTLSPCRATAGGRSTPHLAPRRHAQHAERLGAARLVLVGADEWARGAVSVRDLAVRSQAELPLDQLLLLAQPE
jgi:histidyl-tRNA synthetase